MVRTKRFNKLLSFPFWGGGGGGGLYIGSENVRLRVDFVMSFYYEKERKTNL